VAWRRFNRKGNTRIFWNNQQNQGVLTVAALEASPQVTELTDDIASIQGFQATTTTGKVLGVGTYIATHEHDTGGFRLYDEKHGSDIRAEFPGDTATYGSLYFVHDIPPLARLTIHQAATMGAVDDYASNVAMWTVLFALRSEPGTGVVS